MAAAAGTKEKDRRAYVRRKQRHKAWVYEWRRQNPERHAEIAAEARARWHRKVIRNEVCVECGTRFAWTNRQEMMRRQQGSRVVCSRVCGQRASRRLGKRQPTTLQTGS